MNVFGKERLHKKGETLNTTPAKVNVSTRQWLHTRSSHHKNLFLVMFLLFQLHLVPVDASSHCPPGKYSKKILVPPFIEVDGPCNFDCSDQSCSESGCKKLPEYAVGTGKICIQNNALGTNDDEILTCDFTTEPETNDDPCADPQASIDKIKAELRNARAGMVDSMGASDLITLENNRKIADAICDIDRRLEDESGEFQMFIDGCEKYNLAIIDLGIMLPDPTTIEECCKCNVLTFLFICYIYILKITC